MKRYFIHWGGTVVRVLVLLALCVPAAVLGQTRYTLSGYVRDGDSRENLPGMTIQIADGSQGVVSNSYGYYAISLPEGTYRVVYSYVGYETDVRTVALTRDTRLDVNLSPTGSQLNEVTIQGESIQDNITSARMGSNRLNIEQVRAVPALFGEVDVLKVLQFLPGIKTGNEGTTGFYVRGGSNDQNLILLDEAPVYNASHLGGLFSIFNPDAVQGLQVYKGNFPARYGGRLSSVLDVQLREGNQLHNEFSGGIGLISSRATFEGPIQKERSSFIVSARRTYVDLITGIINRANADDPDYNPIPDYYFYDINAKANYSLGTRDRIFLSGYFGRDVFGFSDDNFNFSFDWGNVTGTLRWNHIFHDKLFANTTFIVSDFDYDISGSFSVFSFSRFSAIRNYIGKVDFDWFPRANHQVKFGAHYIYHRFTPSGLDTDNRSTGTSFGFREERYGNELAAYLSDDWDINPRLRVTTGLRLSGFLTRQRFDGGIEPRVDARYKINDVAAIKASVGRAYQYIHLATNSTASLPTDIWYPTTSTVRPQYGDQAVAGFTYIFPDLGITVTNEFYYKWLYRQVELRDGADLFNTRDVGTQFTFGRGRSYGWELLVEKKEGKTTGWFGYTLSRTTRQFDSLNIDRENVAAGGRTFPFRFDRRHDLSLVINHEFTKRLSATLAFVFRTGDAVTIPSNGLFLYGPQGDSEFTQINVGGASQFVPGGVVGNYVDRNSYRMPNAHRADASVTWKFRPKRGQSELVLSFYNLYNYRNPYFFYISNVEDEQGNVVRFQPRVVSLFPIIPSLTWNFKF